MAPASFSLGDRVLCVCCRGLLLVANTALDEEEEDEEEEDDEEGVELALPPGFFSDVLGDGLTLGIRKRRSLRVSTSCSRRLGCLLEEGEGVGGKEAGAAAASLGPSPATLFLWGLLGPFALAGVDEDWTASCIPPKSRISIWGCDSRVGRPQCKYHTTTKKYERIKSCVCGSCVDTCVSPLRWPRWWFYLLDSTSVPRPSKARRAL